MILDSKRRHYGEGDCVLDLFFINGDNGYPPGVQLLAIIPL